MAFLAVLLRHRQRVLIEGGWRGNGQSGGAHIKTGVRNGSREARWEAYHFRNENMH